MVRVFPIQFGSHDQEMVCRLNTRRPRFARSSAGRLKIGSHTPPRSTSRVRYPACLICHGTFVLWSLGASRPPMTSTEIMVPPCTGQNSPKRCCGSREIAYRLPPSCSLDEVKATSAIITLAFDYSEVLVPRHNNFIFGRCSPSAPRTPSSSSSSY